METGKLRIVTDTEPPKIIAQITDEGEARSPIKSGVGAAVPIRHTRHLDVDGILARSLPKVTETFKKAA